MQAVHCSMKGSCRRSDNTIPGTRDRRPEPDIWQDAAATELGLAWHEIPGAVDCTFHVGVAVALFPHLATPVGVFYSYSRKTSSLLYLSREILCARSLLIHGQRKLAAFVLCESCAVAHTAYRETRPAGDLFLCICMFACSDFAGVQVCGSRSRL